MRFYFVSILTLSLFDCLAEGIVTLFVFGHVSGHLALIKSSGSAFSFTRMLPSIHGFWFGNVLIVAMGTTSSTHVLMNSLTESAYSSMLLSELRFYFVSVLTLSLFNSLAEGIAALFIFGHITRHLALIKSSGSRFQFHANAAINPRFLVWECFYRCYGNDIFDARSNELAHRISVFVNISI